MTDFLPNGGLQRSFLREGFQQIACPDLSRKQYLKQDH